MKNTVLIAFVLFGLLIATSCEKGGEETPEVPQNVIDKSLDLFGGEVLEKKVESEEGIDSWEVKIRNTNGSVVRFYWAVSNQSLVKIEGDQGPFDYELSPGSGLITYSTARTFAVAAVKNDAITKWEVQQEDEFINIWVYTFEIQDDGDIIKVYVDAESGNVLQID
jgi:uncharacterized membrane protein YkoI